MSDVSTYEGVRRPVSPDIKTPDQSASGVLEITVRPEPKPPADPIYGKLIQRKPLLGQSDDPPPATDNVEEWYRNRTSAIEGDIALDDLTREQHAELAATNPLARPTPAVGDVWRAVRSFAGEMLPIPQEASAAEAAPAGQQQDPLQWLLEDDKPPPPPEPGFLDQAWSVAGKIARGALTVPADMAGQAVGGARDAVQSSIDLLYPITDKLAEIVGLPPGDHIVLPSMPEARTVPGALTRGVAQFLTGFYLAGRALPFKGATGVAGGARLLTQGAMADFIAFEGQDAKLADLIKDWPIVGRNAVTEYLSTKADDSDIEGRLKRSLEGIIVSPLIPAFIGTVRAIRSLRHAGVTGKATGEAIAAASPRDYLLIGSEKAPLTATREDAAAGKLVAAGIEAQPGVPDSVLAKAFTDKGLTPLGKDGGPQVFVNFAAVKTGEDIQRVANDMAAAFESTTDEARRGVVSWSTTKASGKNMDAFDLLMKRRSGDAPTAAQVYAFRSLYEASLTKLQDVARIAAAVPTPENLLQMRQMETIALAIQKEFYGARAEAGRALNAFKIPAGDRSRQVEALLNEYGGIDANYSMAQKLAALSKDELGSALEKGAFAKTRDAINQWFYFSILSSPKTHARNIISNTAMIPLTMAETALSARLGQLLGTRDAALVGEAMAQWAGVKMGFADAFRAAARFARTGESSYIGAEKLPQYARLNAISAEAFGARKGSIVGRAVDALGAVTQVTGTALGTADEFFKNVAASMYVSQHAYRRTMSEIASGALTQDKAAARMADLYLNPTETVRSGAALTAAYQTFTDAPRSELVKALIRMRSLGNQADASVGLQAGSFALRLIIPFINTPVKLFSASLERTPLAPITARFRDGIRAGGAEADLALTKMSLGTMTFYTALDMGLNGTITDGGPADKGEYARLYRTGWRPYSMKVGNEYVSYQGLEPIATVLGWAAGISEYIINTEIGDPEADETVENLIVTSLFSGLDTVMSKSYMSSFSDAVAAINDPDQYADYFIRKYAASLAVPNVVREAKNIVDPVQRYTTTAIDEAKSRIPGMSTSLPPRRDAWGRIADFRSDLGGVYDAISPFYVSRYEPQPIDLAMKRDNWTVGMPQKRLTVQIGRDSETVSLNTRPDIYSRYLELQGQVKPSQMAMGGTLGGRATRAAARLSSRYGDRSLLDALNAVVSGKADSWSDRYKALTTAEEREKFMRSIINDYRSAAREVIVAAYPELTDRANIQMKKRLEQQGPTYGLQEPEFAQ